MCLACLFCRRAGERRLTEHSHLLFFFSPLGWLSCLRENQWVGSRYVNPRRRGSKQRYSVCGGRKICYFVLKSAVDPTKSSFPGATGRTAQVRSCSPPRTVVTLCGQRLSRPGEKREECSWGSFTSDQCSRRRPSVLRKIKGLCFGTRLCAGVYAFRAPARTHARSIGTLSKKGGTAKHTGSPVTA